MRQDSINHLMLSRKNYWMTLQYAKPQNPVGILWLAKSADVLKLPIIVAITDTVLLVVRINVMNALLDPRHVLAVIRAAA